MPSRVVHPTGESEEDGIVRSAGEPDNDAAERPRVPVIVVLGPTATGKTALSIQLALAVGGEIVNADARYIYRGMDIGTAKPTPAERRGVPHHLIDIRDPTDDYSLATYLADAAAAIGQVASIGHPPIVVGGTPQYLRGLIEGWRTPEVPPDPLLRERLDVEAIEALFRRLHEVDPESAERIGPQNKRRIIRALEVYEVTGRPMSELQSRVPPPYRLHIIGLRQPREILYRRIDERVAEMFASGWLDEVNELRRWGVTAATPAMSAHGYREALAVLDGTMSLEEAVAHTRTMVHRYVRHQETWFRRFEGVNWYDSSIPGFAQEAIADAKAFLAEATSAQGDRLSS